MTYNVFSGTLNPTHLLTVHLTNARIIIIIMSKCLKQYVTTFQRSPSRQSNELVSITKIKHTKTHKSKL